MPNYQPLVSIIIPTYNRARLLIERAIKSALGQTYRRSEIIVVDDGSVDDTADRLAPYVKGKTVRYLFQGHKGPSAARNVGVRNSSGELVIFLDDDDEFLPDGARVIVEKSTLFPPSVAGFACGMKMQDERGNESYWEPTNIFWENAISGCWALRREVFRVGIWFDEAIRRLEDVDFMMRFQKQFQYAVVRQPVFRHYIKVNTPRLAAGAEDGIYFENSAQDLKKITVLYEDIYRGAGRDAFAWFKRFSGITLCRAGAMSGGRAAMREAFFVRPSAHVFYLWVASLLPQTFFLFFCGLRSRAKSVLRSALRKIIGHAKRSPA